MNLGRLNEIADYFDKRSRTKPTTPMTTTLHTLIDAGLAAPDTGVSPGPRRKLSSFNAQVADLEVGEIATRARRIDTSLSITEATQSLPKLREEFRNAVAPAVRNAKEKTSGEYSVEVVDITTTMHGWMLLALVTRTA